MTNSAQRKPDFPITVQCLLTENLFAVFRYFGFEFSSTKVAPRKGPPVDPMNTSLEHFYAIQGVSFTDDEPPKIQLKQVLDPLDVDDWCTLVFIAAQIIEQRLGKEHRVEKEALNALENSLREFIAGFGEIGKRAIPTSLPADWRDEENYLRLQPVVNLFWE